MKTLEEKIEKLNAIKYNIEKNEEFLDLLIENNTYYRDNKGQINIRKTNIIYRISCAGRIWTGSDNPNYNRTIQDKKLITKIIDSSKDVIKEHIEEQKQELENIFA